MNYMSFLRLARLHRPVGTLLLLFPSLWGLALASPQLPPFFLIFLFSFGALLMRSAGCVYNDIIDIDFDKQVKRTAVRPLAAGDVTIREAVFMFFILLALSALILFQLSLATILTGFIALILVFLYPWMKRWTYWPQAFLGLTFNIGILMGWFALQPTLTLVPIFFYLGAISWTIGYDTIYAFQDIEDDLLAGVKSSSFVVSSAPKRFLILTYGITLFFWAIGGSLAQLGKCYWPFLSLIGIHFLWQIFTLEEKEPLNCLKRFTSNINIGLLLFIAIVFSRLID